MRVLYPSAGRAHLVGITGAPGSGKSFGIGIDPNYFDVRIQSFHLHRQRSGAATDIQHAVTGTQPCTFQQLFSRRFAPEQFYDRIVEGQKPVVTSCR